MIRGKFRSRQPDAVVEEAEQLAKDGVKEIIVIAQDTTRYGEDLFGEPYLAKLLKRLCKIDGLKWIRVLYCYPDRLTDELIDTFAEEEKLVNYIDLPLQHCDGNILKRMNRHGNRESLTALLNKLRAKVPDMILRSTFITGFPGETTNSLRNLRSLPLKLNSSAWVALPTRQKKAHLRQVFPTRLTMKSNSTEPILLWNISRALWQNTAKASSAKKLRCL